MAVEQHERRARGQRRSHRPFAAGLAAQEARERIGVFRHQFGIGELDHLPGAVGALHRCGIGAGEQRAVGNGRQRAAVKLHAEIRVMETRRRPRRQIVERLADTRRRRGHRDAAIAHPVGRSPGRHRPGPGIGKHREPLQHRRLFVVERRQIEHQRMHRADGRRQCRRAQPRRRQRQIEHFRIDRLRRHRAAFGVDDLLQFDQPPPPVHGEPDHVAERQRQPARRQREFGAFAPGP